MRKLIFLFILFANVSLAQYSAGEIEATITQDGLTYNLEIKQIQSPSNGFYNIRYAYWYWNNGYYGEILKNTNIAEHELFSFPDGVENILVNRCVYWDSPSGTVRTCTEVEEISICCDLQQYIDVDTVYTSFIYPVLDTAKVLQLADYVNVTSVNNQIIISKNSNNFFVSGNYVLVPPSGIMEHYVWTGNDTIIVGQSGIYTLVFEWGNGLSEVEQITVIF